VAAISIDRRALFREREAARKSEGLGLKFLEAAGIENTPASIAKRRLGERARPKVGANDQLRAFALAGFGYGATKDIRRCRNNRRKCNRRADQHADAGPDAIMDCPLSILHFHRPAMRATIRGFSS